MKVVAKALLADPDDKLLLLYRGMTHPNFPGHLDLPGGEIEEGEKWIDAIAREISEETAIKVDESILEKVFEKQYSDVIHVLYIATLPTDPHEIILSWEHTSFKWFTKDALMHTALPSGTDRYYLDVIEYLKKRPN